MTPLKIDFVSDISCPWCVIGLKALDEALASVKGDITAEMHFQPFELNPHMAPEGQEITEHITEKYGITPEQANANRENIRARGADVGYFTQGQSPASHDVLVQIAASVGLDANTARDVLTSNRYASEVREREQFYLNQGIHSVPAVIINDRHLISGGQPAQVFEQALRQIAAEQIAAG